MLAASANTSTASNTTGLLDSSTDTLSPLINRLLSAKPIAENVAVVGTVVVNTKLPSLPLVVPIPFKRTILASATGLLFPSVTTPETVVWAKIKLKNPNNIVIFFITPLYMLLRLCRNIIVEKL